MQVFVKTLTGQTLCVSVEEATVASLKAQLEAEQGIPSEEMRLLSGTTQLCDADELTADMTVTMTMRLAGGKKKKKKKNHTTPKRIPHVHVTKKMRVIEYFQVDGSGKITKLKQESKEAGCYLADHKDRMHCGKTGYMFYKLTADKKRIAPVQNKPKKAAAAPVDAKKKKKKK